MPNVLLYFVVGFCYTLFSTSYLHFLVNELKRPIKQSFKSTLIDIPIFIIIIFFVGWILVSIARLFI